MAGSLLREQRGEVVVLTVDRPARRNALDPDTILALAEALRAATADPGTRVAILSASGTESFGSGMDLRALSDARDAAGRAVAVLHGVLFGDERLPLVAAVNGSAMAGGFELALACDLGVAADHARFGLPEVRHGLLAGGGATLLPCRIPIAVALELGLTGEPISAQRAHALGLVNDVVPSRQVLERALELSQAIASNAPLAVHWMRRAMRASLDGVQAGLETTRLGQQVVSGSEDMREGVAAFLEKRTPRWSGR